MRLQIALAVFVLEVACTPSGRQRQQQAELANKQPAQEASATNEPAPRQSNSETNAPGAESRTGVLPSADAAVRYLGTWASSVANCKSKPWRFKRDSLDVANGPRCSFYNVAKVPGGYDIAAQCPTKQPIHTDLIKLRFAQSARAMLVESNAISPTGLVYCSS